MDTLVIFNNHTEFRRAVYLVSNHYSDFDLDVNVSVFETTIRILGGLLSAHLLATDGSIGIYDDAKLAEFGPGRGSAVGDGKYDGWLLELALDLGTRLMPAFRTNTGIPYGTVNVST